MNTTTPAIPYKPKDKNNDGDNDTTIIVVIVVLFLLLLIACAVFYYFFKKRRDSSVFCKYKKPRHKTQTREKSHNIYVEDHLPPQPSQLGFENEVYRKGYDNEALDHSQQDIELGYSASNESDGLVDSHAPPSSEKSSLQHHPIDDEYDDNSKMTYDISIKLLTPWDDVYNDEHTKECRMMKQMIENEIQDIYFNDDDFRSVQVTRFRCGSVICDVKLTFASTLNDPLGKLQNAVLEGTFRSLQADKTFFIDWRKIDGGDLPLNSQISSNEKKRSANRDNRIESGYGSQYFDPKQVVAKLTSRPKTRENSQKSIISADSVISETGTSLSVSPKSTSSTNLSMHEETKRHDKNSHLNQRMFRRKKRKRTSKLLHEKRNENDFLIGQPHIVTLDFSPKDDRELAVSNGDKVTIIRVSDSGWVKVVDQYDNQGWVPHSFLVHAHDFENTKKAVESIIYLDKVIDSLDSPSLYPSSPLSIDKTLPHIPSRDGRSDDSSENGDDAMIDDDISGLFVTVFPFVSTDVKELSIDVGDVIDVLQTSESGWWKGRCLRTYNVGWFPSSYVKPQSVDMDLTKFLGVEESNLEKGTVSDSELHQKCRSSLKDFHDYNSDDGVNLSVKKHKAEEVSNEIICSDNVQSTDTKNNDGSVCTSSEYKTESALTDDPIDEPSKPVPPKPRKRHIQEVFRNLAAEGKLGSTESLIRTQSHEYLAPGNRHGRLASDTRRNSDGFFEDSETEVRRRYFPTGRIDRIRPRSFQESPKTSFMMLSNKYAASMKPAWSLPALNSGINDQVKLSPDDERPYLEPIPRKRKPNIDLANSTEKSEKSFVINGDSPHRLPLRKSLSEGYDRKTSSINSQRPLSSDHTHLHKPKNIAEKPHISKMVAAKKLNKRQSDDKRVKELETNGNVMPHSTRGSASRIRGAANMHRTFAKFESTIFEENEHLNSPVDEKNLMSRSEEDLSSLGPGGSSNASTDNSSFQHRRYHSEPFQGALTLISKTFFSPELTEDSSSIDKHFNNKQDYQELSPEVPKNETVEGNNTVSKEDTLRHNFDNSLSPNSRTSSIQSLASLASSQRSTTSNKHEQMNLRRAIVNVHGEGANDLSFKIGAILYELRPRNKNGLCFGLLDDSTQGWYPAESVEPFSGV